MALSDFNTKRYRTTHGVSMKIAESTCLDMQAIVPGILYSLGRRHVLTLLVGNEATTTFNPSWKMSQERFMWRTAATLIPSQARLAPTAQACSECQSTGGLSLHGTTQKGPRENITGFCLWRKLLTEVQRHSKYLVKNGFSFLLGSLHSQFHSTFLHLSLENSHWNCTFL